MRRVVLILAAVFAAIVTPISAAQDVFDLPPDESYLQAASGMTFPPSVGPFERLATATRFSPDGTDESVGYRLRTKQGNVDATVYVYLSPTLASASAASGGIDAARRELCAAQFAGVLREIAAVHRSASLVEESETSLTQRGISLSGHKLAFTVSGPSAFGKTHQALRSEAYLFCYVGGRWSVKYRFTSPVALDAQQAIETFMRELVWTIEPETL